LDPAGSSPAGYKSEKSGPFIELESAEAHRNTLLIRISYHELLDPFLTSGLFYARYDFTIEEIPPSMLSIPLLGFLAPLAWLTGAEIRAEEIDEDYLNSLPVVAEEFRKMYPHIPFSGAIRANPVHTPSQWDREKYCVLYSGGVDSTCSLIRNIGKKPSTLTIRGAPDLPLQDDRYWARVQERTQRFVKDLGAESHFVETNALGMVNQQAIRDHFRSQLRIGWWEGLAFGLFFLSMSAPYTYRERIGNVIIGSSNTAKTQVPWGSSPMTDEKVRWGDVKVIHDSYDLEKGDKIRQILVPYAKEHGGAIPLRVCIGRRSIMSEGDQINCGQCPKCMVVELSLILAGADAGDFGFNISPGTLAGLRQNLEEGEFGRTYDKTSWRFIKENARSAPIEITSKHPGLRDFLDWFAAWNERPTKKVRFLDRVAPPGSRRRDLARAGFGKREN
jgi:hypothetical protein